MTETTTKSAYLEGIRDGLPFVAVVLPFAALYGVVATEAGLTLMQAMGFTTLVIAGAAQFAALQLMIEGAAVPLVLLGALAVNLRMMMYSAALVPHLGPAPLWQRALVSYLLFDQTYAMSVARFESAPPLTVRQGFAYFMGVATPITPIWYGATLVGVLAGSTVPPWLSLDFALPLTFLAMVAPMLKSVAHVSAAVVSVVGALVLSGLPSGTGLLIAAIAAMFTGAVVESWGDSE